MQPPTRSPLWAKAAAKEAAELAGLLVRTPRAAELLGISESWLEKARLSGQGPRFVKISPGIVGYQITDLLAFIQNRTRRSTSDMATPSPEATVSDPPQPRRRRNSDARRRAITT
jgi:predicted DNA-binding transcriptional regulator AlpA